MKTHAQLFAEHEKIIYDVAARYRKSGHDYDESVSEGHITFMKTMDDFDPAKGSFAKRLRILAQYAILKRARRESRRARHRTECDLSTMTQPTHLSLSRVLSEVSEDARTALDLVLNDPTTEGVDRSKWKANNYRRSLVQILQSQGWIPDRIARVFEEIQEVLHDPDYSSA